MSKTPLDRVLDFLFQWDKGDLIAQVDHRPLTYADLAQLAEMAKSSAATAERIAAAIEAHQEQEESKADRTDRIDSYAGEFFARGEGYGFVVAARICRGLDPVPTELPPGALTLEQLRNPWGDRGVEALAETRAAADPPSAAEEYARWHGDDE